MKKILPLFLLCCISIACKSQEPSLLDGMEDSTQLTEKVTGAFKSTRVINAHSLEMLAKGSLDFRIMHRFGFVSDGIEELFGLDAATMRMSFDYGISNNLMVGIGRSTFRKEFDVFVKTRILQQTTGAKVMPISLLVAVGGTVWTEDPNPPIPDPNFSERASYYVQLIAGRKFNSKFSFQLSPIILHSGMPVVAGDDETIFALGGGGRYKFSKRMAFTIDYHHPFGNRSASLTDPLSVGVDIETGGHVFQLQFSNAIGMNERAYIAETRGDFFKGDIRFGFNLSRIFQTGKRKW